MTSGCFHGKDGLEADLAACFEWFSKAAQGGDKCGQYQLGMVVVRQCGEEMLRNRVEALKWYELAAAQGHAVSMFHIGGIYEAGGFGVDQDLNASFDWLNKASKVGRAKHSAL